MYVSHPKEYYEFDLRGVIVHLGTADAGHYYSFINAKRHEEAMSASGKPRPKYRDKNRWFEFNDSLVRPFNLNARVRISFKLWMFSFVLQFRRCHTSLALDL
jgi:ubiquitin C-terminal hydrolase